LAATSSAKDGKQFVNAKEATLASRARRSIGLKFLSLLAQARAGDVRAKNQGVLVKE